MSSRSCRIAVVEPYLGGSHRAWAEGYAMHSGHDVDVFGHDAVHWKWRMQGAHVTLAPQIIRAAAERGPFDAVFVSGMTNAAALRGLIARPVGDPDIVLYMHENQLTFPMSPDDREDLTYPMINWMSMVAADTVVFNSEFHRCEWFDALPGFLRRLPDQRHHAQIESVEAKSVVCPVGVDLRSFDRVDREARARPLLLWNQRWEYDKGPAEFVAAVEALVAAGVVFDVALLGDRPSDETGELAQLRSALGERLVADEHADQTRYRSLLRSADVVVSTARHEFFGIAVTEAIYAGAMPVLPNRLVYPERIPARHHAASLYDDFDDLVSRLTWALTNPSDARRIAEQMRPTMFACDWSVVAPRYDSLFDERSCG